MSNSLFFKLAASGIVLGTTITGGATLERAAFAASASGAKPALAARKADAARDALAKGKPAKAIILAETAVAASPKDGGYRALLGQTYLSSGRFASAITAFDDAMTLGMRDPQTVIGLILAKIAEGDSAGALILVESHRDMLPVPDVGLAQALAGDSEGAIYTLTAAARAPDASARTRQNLAFSLAMSGRWAQARIVASQDLSIAKIDARMAEWSAMAQQSHPAFRVASLIGVKPVKDGGLPVRLALVAPSAPVAMAAADDAIALAAVQPATSFDPAPVAQYAPPPPVEMALAVPKAAPVAQPVEPLPAVAVAMAQTSAETAIRTFELPMPTTAKAAAEGQIILADTRPYRVAPRIAGAEFAARKPVSVAASETRPAAIEARALAVQLTAPRVASFDTKKPSGWAVQLGAFDTLAVAKGKWTILSKRNGQLAYYPASSQSASVKGRVFYRLTVNGLGSRADAMNLCATLQASGQTCFVRQMSTRETVRWASRPGVKLAAR